VLVNSCILLGAFASLGLAYLALSFSNMTTETCLIYVRGTGFVFGVVFLALFSVTYFLMAFAALTFYACCMKNRERARFDIRTRIRDTFEIIKYLEN